MKQSILLSLVVLVHMPMLHSMSEKESAEVVALMKVMKYCAVKQTAFSGNTVYYPMSKTQTYAMGEKFKKDCAIAEERLHAILTKNYCGGGFVR